MAESVTPTSGGVPTTSGAQATASQGRDTVSTSSTFSSMEELRLKEPKLYKVMMEGLAMQMINQMKRQQDHLKQTMREGRRQARM